MGSVDHLRQRKGAFRIALIPPEVLEALNDGLLETVNLNEFLALELPRLARSVATHIGLDPGSERLSDTFAMLGAFKPMQRHGQIARALYDLTAQHPERDAVAHLLATHPSDVARCWATHWIPMSGLALPEQLNAVRRFAADAHFGVRELAWMAVRDATIQSLDEALRLLQPWAADPDPNIRRFASELTRPRGVWCEQIERLKAEPWAGVALLELLRADPSRYVQNSVANWLNDASRSQPAWVEEICARWLAESDATETRYIVRRALRTLSKRTAEEP
ncbi:DNA alkylation repair protein [Variovorax sp. J22P240]|uniref:DNA alkylation repair protein n=1 Tax=Variovorax sp. J22P240 TaxID=3053514 RepID=UPI0025791DD8|nr:DNA alkylation repair protein [Variovorax sp. J22P240]MDL9999797.1 DNA alkylation repair protein [Variovorax sp. J22P240]